MPSVVARFKIPKTSNANEHQLGVCRGRRHASYRALVTGYVASVGRGPVAGLWFDPLPYTLRVQVAKYEVYTLNHIYDS